MKKYLIPLALFIGLVGFLAVGLRLNPRDLPSPLIGKAVPAYELPQLHDPALKLTAAQMKGQVWVLNVFASWCTPCLAEHPLVAQMAKSGVKVIGLNYKDSEDDAKTWLKRHGDPYAAIAVDRDGRVGIDWGVYGVPETFVVDRNGVIRHKQIGPITPAALKDEILPLIAKLHG